MRLLLSPKISQLNLITCFPKCLLQSSNIDTTVPLEAAILSQRHVPAPHTHTEYLLMEQMNSRGSLGSPWPTLVSLDTRLSGLATGQV